MSGIKAQQAAKTRAKSLAHRNAAASTKRKMAPVQEIAVKINNSAGAGIELCSASTRIVVMATRLMPLGWNNGFGRFFRFVHGSQKAKPPPGQGRRAYPSKATKRQQGRSPGHGIGP
jgi:hypothetical protein